MAMPSRSIRAAGAPRPEPEEGGRWASPIRVLLASANAGDLRLARGLAESCEWRMTHVGLCSEFKARVAEVRPAVVIVADALPDGDWRQVLWSAWDLVETPCSVLIADELPPRLSTRAKALDVGWMLRRPLTELSLLRAVVQGWRRWSAGLTP
jgi:AmiR/NasT family two-component response regulator